MFTESFKKNYEVGQKMQWFVDAFNNNTLVDLIGAKNKPAGTVIMPTGYGKSGFMFVNAVNAINHIKESNGKIVIIFAAPILRLIAQTQNDFNQVLGSVLPELRDSNAIKFFVNSSASESDYDVNSVNSDVHYIDDFDKVFIKNKKAKVALIASCFNSLDKTVSKLKYIKKHATLCCYIDEAHKFISRNRTDAYAEGKKECDMGKYAALGELVKQCDYLYALTATEDSYVTEKINKTALEKYGDDFYKDSTAKIVEILGKQAIRENIIVPFNLWFSGVDLENEDIEYPITPNMCIDYMKQLKELNSNNVHEKMLICATGTEHLKYLAPVLKETGIKVFATSSETGAFSYDKDNNVISSELQKEIMDYDGDCFLIHIHQLKQGIDIPCITSVIEYQPRVLNIGEGNDNIQVIGRSLRTMPGERGMEESKRSKKCANVCYVLPNGDMAYHIAGQLENLLINYYGFDGVRFTGHGHAGRGSHIGDTKIIKSGDFTGFIPAEDVYEVAIEQVKINMNEYLKEKVEILVPRMKKMGFKNIEEELRKDLERLSKLKHFDEYSDWSVILSDTDLVEMTSEVVKKYDIK